MASARSCFGRRNAPLSTKAQLLVLLLLLLLLLLPPPPPPMLPLTMLPSPMQETRSGINWSSRHRWISE